MLMELDLGRHSKRAHLGIYHREVVFDSDYRQLHAVGKNLHDAMSKFRSIAGQDIRSSSRDGTVDLRGNEEFGATASGLLLLYNERIWIHALCINQLDLAERNLEVAIMN